MFRHCYKPTVIACALVGTLALIATRWAYADIPTTLHEYYQAREQLDSGTPTEDELAQLTKEWIGRLDREIYVDCNSPAWARADNVFAQLSLEVFSSVYNDKGVGLDARVVAAVRAYNFLSASSKPLDVVDAYLQDVANLVNEIRNNKLQVLNAADAYQQAQSIAYQRDIIMANMIAARGIQETRQLSDEAAREHAKIEYTAQALSYADKYLEQLEKNPPSGELLLEMEARGRDDAKTLLTIARLADQTAESLVERDNAATARKFRESAVAYAEKIMDKYPVSGQFSQDVGEFWIGAKLPILEKPSEFLDQVRELITHVEPGFQVLEALSPAYLRLRDSDNLEYQLLLIGLADIAIEKFPEWVPDRYEKDPSYKHALGFKFEALVKMGALDEAEKVLAQFRSVSLESPIVDQVVAEYERILEAKRDSGLRSGDLSPDHGSAGVADSNLHSNP
ncbi:MAG: hypothetical protein IT365_20980 [Candidatus Hydrogenedentes bacterium]|nr:hypothetical protein [Candidatus Hydrogenedentota bacterium]